MFLLPIYFQWNSFECLEQDSSSSRKNNHLELSHINETISNDSSSIFVHMQTHSNIWMYTHAHEQTNKHIRIYAWTQAYTNTNTRTLTSMCVCTKFSGTAESNEEMSSPVWSVPKWFTCLFYVTPKSLHCYFRKKTIRFPLISNRMHTCRLVHWFKHIKSKNRSITLCILHTHTLKFNAPGKYYPLQGKKILCQCLFLLHFFPLFCMVWSKRKSEHSSQTNEKSNLWFTLQRPFHYDLRRRQCK